jgi:hypothetical protein
LPDRDFPRVCLEAKVSDDQWSDTVDSAVEDPSVANDELNFTRKRQIILPLDSESKDRECEVWTVLEEYMCH